MKPGRELDALIAEKVMGLSFPAPAIQCTHLLKPYSTDIAAAWQVVQNFQARKYYTGFWVSDQFGDHCCPDDDKGPWYSATCLGHGVISASGETAAHAICLAALEAVGHNSNGDGL